MRKFGLILFTALVVSLTGCTSDKVEPDPVPTEPENPQPEPQPEDKHGIAYIYDGAILPEIHLTVPLDQWNTLLDAYDRNHDTKEQVHCDVRYVKGTEETVVKDAGLRLRGNTSRRRPEGQDGQKHVARNTDWHHCHYQINFRKFVKDDEHKVHGAKKVIVKWPKDDAMYVRELYCYDLFHRAGVWSASNAAYCRLFIRVVGDSKETYLGVHTMIEPIDDDFLKVRKDQFGSSKGNLWKCRYGATFADAGADIGADLDDGVEHTYELKTNTDKLTAAKSQLQDFITNAKGKSGKDFHDWIGEHCDVDLLLRTYAVNVACGMWDDYWCNSNNFYIYFNSTDKENYRFYFIPYDYDNTLGTSGLNMDAGRKDPFNWGDSGRNYLIHKIIQFDDYREIYRNHLLELVKSENGLLYYNSSIQRIKGWHKMISEYIVNDTGEDCVLEDRPALWGNHGEYRLLEIGTNNFFMAKTLSINQYCK